MKFSQYFDLNPIKLAYSRQLEHPPLAPELIGASGSDKVYE